MDQLHQLKVGDIKILEINANEEWSSERIETKIGEKYKITCDPNQRWTDWFIKCTPNGFFNILSYLAGQRVKGVKCFCLCGAYNKDLSTGFAIGRSKEFDVSTNGQLFFFPNDTAGHYKNNKGSIFMNITRMR